MPSLPVGVKSRALWTQLVCTVNGALRDAVAESGNQLLPEEQREVWRDALARRGMSDPLGDVGGCLVIIGIEWRLRRQSSPAEVILSGMVASS